MATERVPLPVPVPSALVAGVPSNLTYVHPNTGYPYKDKVDYGLYLITARETLPARWLEGRDELSAYEAHLDAILATGAVTILQLREKGKSGPPEGGALYELALRTLNVCDRHNVPLVIDDNLGLVAALPKRVGLHLGQSDLPLAAARAVLGPDRIIGISTKRVPHVQHARSPVLVDTPWSGAPRTKDGLYVLPGADYVGIGTLYPTQSKVGIPDADVIGPRGAKDVVKACYTPQPVPESTATALGVRFAQPAPLPCVLIGGINRMTAARALYGATSSTPGVDGQPILASPQGIAVISDIYVADDPPAVARSLKDLWDRYQLSLKHQESRGDLPLAGLGINAKDAHLHRRFIMEIHRAHTHDSAIPPLVQTLTSHVSANLSANVALCMHASPIMSQEASEAFDLSNATSAAVLNIGTISPEARRGMRAVGQAANLKGKPVVLDPVGVGASAFRREAVEEILNHTQVTLIKGNAAEISTLAGVEGVKSRGVDSGSGSLENPAQVARLLAQKERCLVLLTGKIDYLTDGERVAEIRNGDPYLGTLTATGCSLGVAVAVGLARASDPSVADRLLSDNRSCRESPSSLLLSGRPDAFFWGALWGVLYFEVAAQKAALKVQRQGPGTFLAAWLDCLASLTVHDLETLTDFSLS